MKTLSRLAVLFVLVVAALAATSPVAFGATHLVFSDEFNGPLNTANWTNDTPWNTHYTTGELEYYDPANCTFANGMMTLKSEDRPNNGYPYTSAIVTSLPHTKFSYGYFEIRAKIPGGRGLWPSFWLTNDSTLEIDTFEELGDRPTRLYMTLHENDSQIYQGIKDGPDYSAGFHTYAIDWQPTYVKWYIDGVECAAYNHAMPADPMWICLNTTVGGSWSGMPSSTTHFPVDYDIDYIRVYDHKPAAESAPVANADSYSTANNTPKTVGAPGVLANDTDADADQLTASVVSQPEHGTVSMTSDGAFTYTPDADFAGIDSYTYTASDGQVSSAPAKVLVGVAGPGVRGSVLHGRLLRDGDGRHSDGLIGARRSGKRHRHDGPRHDRVGRAAACPWRAHPRRGRLVHLHARSGFLRRRLVRLRRGRWKRRLQRDGGLSLGRRTAGGHQASREGQEPRAPHLQRGRCGSVRRQAEVARRARRAGAAAGRQALARLQDREGDQPVGEVPDRAQTWPRNLPGSCARLRR